MPDLRQVLADFLAQVPLELRKGVLGVAAIIILGLVFAPAKEVPTATVQAKDPMQLLASPDEPLMAEAIKMAQATNAADGPWALSRNKGGATATFKTAGGAITLSAAEIAEANYYYPQLVANPGIARSNSRTSLSPQADLAEQPGDWD